MADTPRSTDEHGSAPSRRALLKGAGIAAGAVWVAPVVDSVFSAAAAASGTVTTQLLKTVAGNSDPPLLTTCTAGATSNTGRGSVTFTRTESTQQICATITISSGPSITGRSVYILQSNAANACLGGTNVPADALGTWAASPANGPQTFCATLIPGATQFVVNLNVSGGGGTDSYSSLKVSLP